MAAASRAVTAVLVIALLLAFAGCSTGDSTDDSKIIAALNLKEAGNGYEMNGDPFCRVDEVLNDATEVEEASEKKGIDFVIAAPKGEIGVLAHPPFAPSCKREASDALKRLTRPSKKSE
jgi:hypothetical protein